MPLKEVFCSVPLRERAGPRTAARFDYQLHWALCHLLGLHESGEDYLITFDYHDDILVFDSESDPKKVDFIQVKTSDKAHWTLHQLIRPRTGVRGNLLSILGRLYDNRLRFPDDTSSLTLLSNIPFKIPFASDRNSLEEQHICAEDFDEATRTKIRKSLQAEHGLSAEPDFEPVTFLRVTDLPLRGHSTYVKGELSDFLDRLVPEGRFPVVRIFRVLMDDIRRRNNYDRVVSTFPELVEQKSIGRTEFQRIIDRICVLRDPNAVWRDIENRLRMEHVDLSAIYRLKNAWTRLEVKRMNLADSHLRLVMDAVGDCITEILESESITGLRDLLPRVVSQFRALPIEGEAYGDEEIHVIALAKQFEL